LIDFVLGTKKSILVGTILQGFGFSLLSIFGHDFLLLSLLFISLGVGLISPSILSEYAKSQYDKIEIQDSSYLIYSFAINIGAFLGGLCFSFIIDLIGNSWGFLLLGVFTTFPLLVSFWTTEKTFPFSKKMLQTSPRAPKKTPTYIFFFIGITLFVFLLYQQYDMRFNEVVSIESMNINPYFIFGVPLITILLELFLAVFWSFRYSTQQSKLTISVCLLCVAFIVLFGIQFIPKQYHAFASLISILIFYAAEVFSRTVIYSLILQHINPRYITSAYIITSLPMKTIPIFGFLYVLAGSQISFFIELLILLVLSSSMIYFTYIRSKKK
jgi:dipeptide/tripeptide permease